MILKIIKAILPRRTLTNLRVWKYKILGYKNRNDLTALATVFQSDKWGKHYYTPHYQKHFQNFKNKKIKILEIGVGGNKSPTYGGASLRMWKNYFRKGRVFGIDIYDKSALEENRIKIFKGSQDDEEFLNKTVNEIGELDIIIDDGSHINEHIIKSFKILFPNLKNGGIYVVEDLQTSYWKSFGGNSEDLNDSSTAMNFFKSFVDSVNHKELIRKDYVPSYFDENIISIHFYHNLVFVCKGRNKEPSSFLVDNKIPKNKS